VPQRPASAAMTNWRNAFACFSQRSQSLY
jgi:hypothetical protein